MTPISKQSQLQWVALLAIAMVLPTVTLLWFMSRVVANERLVVRQKVAALHQDKLTDAAAKTESRLAKDLDWLDQFKPGASPYVMLRQLVLEKHYQGAVWWNPAGELLYPRPADVLGNSVSSDSPLAEAWQQEFARQQYADAARLYDMFIGESNPQVALAARLGKSRCLARLGRLNDAIQELQPAAYAAANNDNAALRPTVTNARLLLLSLLNQSSPPQIELLRRTLDALADELYDRDAATALPPNQNLFVAKKYLEMTKALPSLNNAKEVQQIAALVVAEELSIAAAETLGPDARRFDRFFPTDLGGQPSYCLRHRAAGTTLLVLYSPQGLAPLLSAYEETFAGSAATCRILNEAGTVVAGEAAPNQTPFATAALPDSFPGWKVELYFKGGDVFEQAARRQIAVYTWTGILVILLVLITGAVATRAVGRQIRLNRMKNDFIATVSHELKTPLASMRVLVDTLLEGNVRDDAQAKEYLRLTAKENERLSRMIDNFLTFSRMERNKNAFTLTDASPPAIARDAVEAVQTKFATHHCHLTVEIPEHLPEIQADHDAMVTVLVNLLDNACKYTGDDKRIALSLSDEAGSVCFSVSDNGIGLARRHLRKIFDSFYQVDSSLARRAEGCGLGLSIVKFIVDAHKGKVTVESKPGKGSKFTVRLPVGRKNGE